MIIIRKVFYQLKPNSLALNEMIVAVTVLEMSSDLELTF